MKKDFKNYKALSGKFILLVIFILLIANRTLAQCPTAVLNVIDIDHDQLKASPSCYGGSPRTDIGTIPPYNVATNLITIGNKNFVSPTADSMIATNITITKPGGGGFGPLFPTATGAWDNVNNAGGFNESPYAKGIQFKSVKLADKVVLQVTGPPMPPYTIGYTFNFTIKVYGGGVVLTGSDGTSATRDYSFTIAKNGYIVGDPHIATPDSLTYDFQQAGEFIALRGDSGDNFEIQTRHTPVTTSPPIMLSNNTTGLSTCVSLITAVAIRVGTHRVTWEPDINNNGNPDPGGMQLRVDGALTTLNDNGIDLGSGSRISRILKSTSGRDSVIEIDFPDGASLIASSNWWNAYGGFWYLNLNIYRNIATKGIMGIIPALNPGGVIERPSSKGKSIGIDESKSWLPALPDGTSVGSMPGSLQDRFDTLYKNFAIAWRVDSSTSLFDYPPGKSTKDFTDESWPTFGADSCSVRGNAPLPPIGQLVAQQLCAGIVDPNLRADAIFDVMVTGDSGFAKAYLLTQQIQVGATATIVNATKDTTKHGEPVTFTATVYRNFSTSAEALAGSVEFTVDGDKVGQSALDANGKAVLTTTSLKSGTHKIAARFVPESSSTAFSSSSFSVTHTVIGGGTGIVHEWWFWLIIIIILLIIIFALRKKKP